MRRALVSAMLAAAACGGAPAEPQTPAPVLTTAGPANCGEHSCDPATSYCYQSGGGAEVESDAPSPPLTSRCEPFATTCAVDPPDCSCLSPGVDRFADCKRDGAGLVRVFEPAP